MSRSVAVAALLLGFVFLGALTHADAQATTDGTEKFQFWDEQVFPLEASSRTGSLSQAESAAEHFDGDADDVYFDLKEKEDRYNEEDNNKAVMDKMPCDQDVTDEDAMMMEGDLQRLRLSVSDDQPSYTITTYPIVTTPVFGSLLGPLMQQLAVDPLQTWLDRQLRAAREMEMFPSRTKYVDGDEEQAYDTEEWERDMGLESLSRLRFNSAMSDLFAGSDRNVEKTSEGFTEDGGRWTSSQGSSGDGSSRWYSFSMSYNGNEQQQPLQRSSRMWQVTESMDEDQYDKEDYSDEEEDEEDKDEEGQSDWDSWMASWSSSRRPFDMMSAHRAAHKKSHMLCAVILGCIAGPALALIGLSVWRARRASPSSEVSSSVQEPLLAPVSAADHAEPCLVVAADHADLEKHYVNIKYVPLNGE